MVRPADHPRLHALPTLAVHHQATPGQTETEHTQTGTLWSVMAPDMDLQCPETAGDSLDTNQELRQSHLPETQDRQQIRIRSQEGSTDTITVTLETIVVGDDHPTVQQYLRIPELILIKDWMTRNITMAVIV